MSKRIVLPILIGVIVIATFMRLYGLDRQSLWYDEVAEETGFQRQFLIKNAVLKPYTPPLNLFFIYPITQIFPNNDFALRMVPFTFGVISVPLFFLLGKRLFNEKIGLIASFILAISPFHIWYSQEVRMYALQWMLALISMLFFLRMLERPDKVNTTVYIMSTTAGLYTHQLAVFLIALQGLYILFLHNKNKTLLIKFLGVLSVNIILYLPWIIYSLTSFADKQAGFPKEFELDVILYTFYSFSAGFSIGPSLSELHLSRSITAIKPYSSVIVPLTFIYSMLFMLGVWSSRKHRPQFILMMLLLIVPIAGLVILNQIMPNIAYNVRYTGMALFAYLLFITKGLDHLSNLKPRSVGNILVILSVIAIIGFSLYSYVNYQFDNRYAKPNIRGAVAYIENNRIPGDLVLCVIDNPVFDKYSNNDRHYISFPHYTNHNDKTDVEFQLKKIVRSKKRLWLVLNTEWYQPKLVDYAKSWLDTNFEEIKHLRKVRNEIANVRIYAYDLTRNITQ